MEQIIQQLKNIFADPNFRDWNYVKNIWENLLNIKEVGYVDYLHGLEGMKLNIKDGDLYIWKYEETSNIYGKFVLNIFPINGWNTKLEIVQDAQTNDLTSPPLSSEIGDKDLENSSF